MALKKKSLVSADLYDVLLTEITQWPGQESLTARDREICERIGPMLKQQGLIFVGIDVIGDWLTEINVTSPTGLQEIDRFDSINSAGLIWDRIEARVRTDQAQS